MIDSNPASFGDAYIQHRCFHEFPKEGHAGRNNWACEIEAENVAKYVEKHVKWWLLYRDARAAMHDDKDVATGQIRFWELWQDFLITIEPTAKLRLTMDDYKFFFRGIGIIRTEG